jgi:uncharacterized membrane protein YqiK
VVISEIVEKLNNKEKMDDLAAALTMSKDTLRKKLKSVGYVYNNSTKIYEFIGEQSEKNKIDSKEILKQTGKRIQNKVRKNSEINQNEVKQNVEFPLTEEEIKFVKDSYQRRNRAFSDRKFEVSWEKSQLPSRKPEKKTPYIISEKTFDEFRKFADSLENEYRVTQNELVEIALQKLMREWR